MVKITKLITLTLALVLTLVVGITTVNAETYRGTCGENEDNLTWEYDGTTKTLTISGTGAMEDWQAGYATPWGSYQMEITTVIVEDGVTNIGKEAFSNYHALTSVTLPNSVTDIRFHAFQGSENLKNINLPANLTTIGGAAFYGCYALTDVTIPDGVEAISDSAFANCDSLTNVVMGNNVKIIDYQAFYRTNIQSIDLPSSVKAIYTEAFARTKIEEFTIPRSVTQLGGGIFNDCNELTTIIYEGTEEEWKELTNGVRLGVDLSTITVNTDTKWRVKYELNGGEVKPGFDVPELFVDSGYEYTVPTWKEISDIIDAPSGKKYAGAVEIDGNNYNVGDKYEVTEDTIVKLLWNDIDYTCGEHRYDEKDTTEQMIVDQNKKPGDQGYAAVVITFTCTKCGNEETKDAKINDGVDEEPTCEIAGKYRCNYSLPVDDSLDGEPKIGTFFERIEPLGHDWAVDFRWTGDETNGYTKAEADYTCSRCGKAESVEADIEERVTEPACETAGKTTYTATVSAENSPDGKEISDSKDAKPTEALGHTFDQKEAEDDYLKRPADCTHPAEYYVSCSVCDASSRGAGDKEASFEHGDPLGHDWIAEFKWTGDETNGYTKAEANYTCSRCEIVTNAEADIEESVTEPACETDGKTTYTAKVSAEKSPDGKAISDSKDAKIIKALGHTWDNGVVTRPATTTEAGTKTYTCAVCKETKTEAIAKLAKKANMLKLKGKTATVKYKKLKKKSQTISRAKAITVSGAQGALTYKKVSVTYTKAKSVKMSKKALKKYKKQATKKITINAKTGKVTVKKGLKKGTYKVKVKVRAAGNANYNPSAWKTVTLKIKVR